MTPGSCQHATFVIERRYAASPERVFAAWAEPTGKARWFNGPSSWQEEGYVLDFRVGGREHFLDGYEDGGSRERGTNELLDKLARALAAA